MSKDHRVDEESAYSKHDYPLIRTTDLGFIPIPTWLRHDPADKTASPFWLNYVFGLASTFTVANLYYCQPLLIQFSQYFDVPYKEVSNIPTLIQGGYAAGILLISPLGDLVRRRPLILLLMFLSGSLTIGLAVTRSLVVFEVLSFLVGVVSVTAQVLIPLAADLAPPSRRASALSIVISAILFGVLIARVLAGIVAEFTTWRAVYYVSIGVQFAVLAACYFVIPDYPAKRHTAPASEGRLTYASILWSMGKFAVTEPLVIQSCLINFCSTACFSNFWVTLTFLLGGPPYNYSTLAIGLFGLLGMLGVAIGPYLGRVIDKLVPWYATLVSLVFLVVFQAVQVGAAGIHIAAVIIACLGLDVFRQTQQVSLSTAVFGISATARARLNALLILSVRSL
ncbi:hypothetical protein HGRIS_005557 [Hohenbuehelia grisea]|uniref:Major facilitator superfamily (MFS) profile domain-containing protein n=1 Tax=Hohenbuehelia grisea TaxID=104357 RepID=A0ABR3JZA0_9AGAR